MPILEIVTPILKQDAATISAFHSVLKPLLSSLIKVAPGAKHQVAGQKISENNININAEQDFRPSMAIEWQSLNNFQDFLKSKDFSSFAGDLKPYATAPALLQLFSTDVSPSAILSAKLTEVFRVPISDSKKSKEANQAWKFFTSALKSKFQSVEVLSGTSLNLEEKMFVGVLGWQGGQMREEAGKDEVVMQARGHVEALEGVDSFLVGFESF